jgi:hypothetical protein
MTAISGQHQLRVSTGAGKVWRAMRRYEDLSWAIDIDEVIIEGEGIGMLRKVRFGGSPDWVLERLTARDDSARTFSYAVDGEGMPGFSNYRAEVRAEPDGHGCIIHWKYLADVENDAVEEKEATLQLFAEGVSSLFAAQFASDHGAS